MQYANKTTAGLRQDDLQHCISLQAEWYWVEQGSYHVEEHTDISWCRVSEVNITIFPVLVVTTA